jgi:succinate dehydrogenase/fumarate reductase-like Fe-S protein
MERLTAAARAHLLELQLDEGRAARVVACAFEMACAEVEPVHIDLGVVIERARQEADLTSAA